MRRRPPFFNALKSRAMGSRESWQSPELVSHRNFHQWWCGVMGATLFGLGVMLGVVGWLGAAAVVTAVVVVAMLVDEVGDAVTDAAWDQHEYEHERARHES